ncbi:hypothetical protein TYRP_015382 [Tyrophagus putrescentiae]|nr:hypothetical protein TYRP_015382 [Tyrophagus putrescentiae]
MTITTTFSTGPPPECPLTRRPFLHELSTIWSLKLKKPIFKYYPGAESSSVPAFLGGKSLLQQEAEIEVHIYESSSSHREGDLYGGKRYFFAGMLNHPHLLEEEWRQTLVGSLNDEGTIATEAFYRAAPMQTFIIPDDEALLTDDFLLRVSALEDVPLTDDNFHLFEDFFDHFGLYYVARFALGGLFRQVGTIDRKLFKEC